MRRPVARVLLLACGLAGAACSRGDAQRWMLLSAGPVSAKFLDTDSIGQSSEPQLLRLLDLTVVPDSGRMLTGKKTYAVWCGSREAQLRSFTMHYDDGRSRPGRPPPDWLERHPADRDPRTEDPANVTTDRATTARLAQIVCDRRRDDPTYVADPARWARDNLTSAGG